MIPPLPLFSDFLLGDPLWLILLPLCVLVPWIAKKMGHLNPSLKFPLFSTIRQANQGTSQRWTGLPKRLTAIGVALVIIALARPQLDRSTETILSSGVDIVLAVDLSASMLALDMSEPQTAEVTRLDVVKEVIHDFIDKRKYDRIGLIAFSVDPYLVSALTLDQEHLQKNLARLRVGLTHETGTNLGSALAEGINRLRPLESKSKILILLSDGKDEPPPPHSPLIYADGAKSDKIKIYTIAIGTNSRTRTYVFDPRRRDIALARNGQPVVQIADYPVDKDTLSKIAERTGAKFFEAPTRASLEAIYDEIDLLEKSEIELSVNALFEDLYPWPLGGAILLLLSGFLLKRTRYLSIP